VPVFDMTVFDILGVASLLFCRREPDSAGCSRAGRDGGHASGGPVIT
jgi:hypothetical protein